MSKLLKIFYRFQGFKCYVCQRHRGWCLCTAYRVLLLISLMSKTSKMPNTIVLCIQGMTDTVNNLISMLETLEMPNRSDLCEIYERT